MKSLFKFLFIFCIAFTTLTFAQDFSFPKYSDNMKNVSACSCTGVFSSCSGSGSCNCSCGYFSCSCSSSPAKIEKISQIDISISRKQFGHIEELAKNYMK